MAAIKMVRFKGGNLGKSHPAPVNEGIYTLEAEEVVSKGRSIYHLKEFPGCCFRSDDFEDVFKQQ